MSTFVLIHGAAADSWYWHPLAGQLRARGHDVITPDLPCDDDSATLNDYADTVVDAIGTRTDVIVVAHSFGGFTAPLVCERVPVRQLVLLSGMLPAPGETPGEWWANTGWEAARRERQERDGHAIDDENAVFFHDVPPQLAAEARNRVRDQSATPFAHPWPLAEWPSTPTAFLVCRHDRFLPAAFQHRVVRERLGMVPDEIDGGHNVALSRPQALADRLADLSQSAQYGRQQVGAQCRQIGEVEGVTDVPTVPPGREQARAA
ncbi:alpha/beta hydrolase [Nonomuraea typhae]|uniref:Alpha/beta hydrolase n=1 Tax=Nonomuraea typhae TaxID=2603600 RepID=A0ABW7YU40_9ACTN